MANESLTDAESTFKSAQDLFEKGRLKAAHKLGSDSYDVWIAVGLMNLAEGMRYLTDALGSTHSKLEQVEALLRRSGT